MNEAPKQFKKSPRRKTLAAKSVSMSAEAKQAYADLMNERDARDLAYRQHLPPDMKR